jgi:hypothetical protein
VPLKEIDKCHGHDLSAEVGERNGNAILRSQREPWRGRDFREPLLLGVLDIMGRRRRHRRQHGESENERRPHVQLFSSCFSSLKKRQSVPCEMILLGLDLVMPA